MSNTTTMPKKTDLYTGGTKLSDRVNEWTRCKVDSITIRTRAKVEIAKLEAKLETVDSMAEDPMEEDSIRDAMREESGKIQEQIENKKSAMKQAIEDNASFEWSEEDNAIFKTYKKNGSADADVIAEPLQAWFDAYGIKIGKDVLGAVATALGGKNKLGARGIVRSGATKYTKLNTKSKFLGVLYGTVAEIMIEKGALKPQLIENDIKEYYAPKKRSAQ